MLHPKSIKHIAEAQRPSCDMGQNLSALKKPKATDKKVQNPRTRKGLFKHLMPRKHQFAASSTITTRSAESSLQEKSSEVSIIHQELSAESSPKTLPALPTELILSVAEYLPLSGYMSLSYSCPTIRNKMGASFAHVIGKISTLSIESKNIRSVERWDLRRMLQRDGEMDVLAAFNGGREATYGSSPASVRWVARLSPKYRSSADAGLMWVCPGRILDFDKATTTGARKSIVCEDTSPWEGGVQCYYRTSNNAYITFWPIMRVPSNHMPSNGEVKEALSTLNAPVCPHLRLNDPCIARACVEDCLGLGCTYTGENFDQVCQCRKCSVAPYPLIVTCNFCGTQILLAIRNQYSDSGREEILNVIVMRSVERGVTCTDRAWICHVADRADFKEYEEAWRVTEAECWRKTKPLDSL